MIRKIYLEMLGREPDKAGFDHFLALLNSGDINEKKLRKSIKESDEYKRASKRRKFAKKHDMTREFYGKIWVGQDFEWYAEMFTHLPLQHKDCMDFIRNKPDVRTVLEVGCGAGVYPIKFKELFEGKKYTGTDISESAIHHCKKNSKSEFICNDFLKLELDRKFDLVFSNNIIDHVYDIDLFLSKIVKLTGKYCYISAYYGYFPELEDHVMQYNQKDGYYLNKLSPSKIRETLLKNGLGEDEFVIRPQPGGHRDIKTGTIIEICLRR